MSPDPSLVELLQAKARGKCSKNPLVSFEESVDLY
jgi:hypothetical protein